MAKRSMVCGSLIRSDEMLVLNLADSAIVVRGVIAAGDSIHKAKARGSS
jgi:hypothetical protein